MRNDQSALIINQHLFLKITLLNYMLERLTEQHKINATLDRGCVAKTNDTDLIQFLVFRQQKGRQVVSHFTTHIPQHQGTNLQQMVDLEIRVDNND